MYRAIRYAVDNGARGINISLGAKGISHLEQVGVNYAYAQGCLVVVSTVRVTAKSKSGQTRTASFLIRKW